MLAYVPGSVERKLQLDPGRHAGPRTLSPNKADGANFSYPGQAVTCGSVCKIEP